jgi:branched-chain amino acid transport system ATP-binding protein
MSEAPATVAARIAVAVTDVSSSYGGREVLSNVSLDVVEGEVLCLVGHNGAGKSTLLKLIFGLHRPSSGSIWLRGRQVVPAPAAMAGEGLAYVPEGRGIFPGLSVNEIFRLALWSADVKGGEAAARIDEVTGLLPRLRDFWSKRAGELSGGQQQMVSIGRALLSRPSILLLDEPSIGLAPKLFQDLIAPVRALQQQRGLSILLVEQNVGEAFTISDRVAVMKSGQIIFRGVPGDLTDRARLMELF